MGNAGNDTFVFAAGQANGDTIFDFVGNGAGAGDTLSFVGFGTAAARGHVHPDRCDQPVDDPLRPRRPDEIITFINGAPVDPTDFLFG